MVKLTDLVTPISLSLFASPIQLPAQSPPFYEYSSITAYWYSYAYLFNLSVSTVLVRKIYEIFYFQKTKQLFSDTMKGKLSYVIIIFLEFIDAITSKTVTLEKNS